MDKGQKYLPRISITYKYVCMQLFCLIHKKQNSPKIVIEDVQCSNYEISIIY
jgi:hypothetical protein